MKALSGSFFRSFGWHEWEINAANFEALLADDRDPTVVSEAELVSTGFGVFGKGFGGI